MLKYALGVWQDLTRADALSIGDFVRYIGQGGRLHVDPSALAAAAGATAVAAAAGDNVTLGDAVKRASNKAFSTAAAGNGIDASELFGSGPADADGPTGGIASDDYSIELREGLLESGVLDEMPHVSTSDLESCIAFYRAFDEDADGFLTPREFVAGLKAYGRATGNPDAYRRRLLLEAFDSADVSTDARLELTEFVKFVGKNGKLNMEMRAMRRAATEWVQLRSFQVHAACARDSPMGLSAFLTSSLHFDQSPPRTCLT